MTDSLLKTSPDTPSVSGEGVTAVLADGVGHEVRFSARAIIRVENTWGSHEAFLNDLDATPVATLAAVLLIASDAKDEAGAVALLDGVNWRELRVLVDAAWRKANWLPESGAAEVPTTGA